MKKPKMILFDYGQTLVNEETFDGLKGTVAVLEYAVKNKYNKTAEEIQEYANYLNKELGRFDKEKQHMMEIEVPNHMFQKYLYESQGIELSINSETMDRVFWDAAAPGEPTEGIEKFLTFLKENQIRTGVISNIAYCGAAVTERINKCIPDHNFEFIIATSEYMFRKPNKHIFTIALEKAGLLPEDVWYIGAINVINGAKEEVLTIKDWKELEKYIEEL